MHIEDETAAEPSSQRLAEPPTTNGPAPASLPAAEGSFAPRRSRRKWLYITAILLLGTITTEPEAASLSERRGEMFGGGIALLFMSIVLASTVCIWRRSTRPLIPGAALILAVIMVPLMEAGKEMEAKEQFAALQNFADSLSNPVDTADAPPRSNDARMLWATRKAMEDLVAHNDALARSHDVDPDNAPDAWLSAAYLADARRHPEVGTYFTQYLAYVREADSTLVPVLTERMRARLVQSGLSRSYIDGFMRGFGRSVARNAERKRLTASLEFTHQALALHAYLISVDSRVHLDDAEEVALFEREADRLHAGELVDRIQRLGREVEAQQRRGREGILELGDSMGIEADTVRGAQPPAGPGTTAAGMSKS
ncbi:MAG TPA: hypothetical protein VF006_33555 [Longimicrobium sp.]